MKNKIRKILLVEDDFDCAHALKFLLELDEYIVFIVNNGLDAVIMAAKEKFDLILMDYEMPVMDGIGAAGSIREQDKDVPIISISSRNETEYINSCYVCGMNGHIPKILISEVIKNNEFEAVVDQMIESGINNHIDTAGSRYGKVSDKRGLTRYDLSYYSIKLEKIVE